MDARLGRLAQPEIVRLSRFALHELLCAEERESTSQARAGAAPAADVSSRSKTRTIEGGKIQ